MRTIYPLTAAVALLAGCNATLPQQQTRPTAADDPSNSCFDYAARRQEIAPLLPKVPVSDGRRPSLEMLTDTSTPTPEEKVALSKWAQLRSECVAAGRDFRARYAPPGWAAAIEQANAATMQLIATLYAGGSYGQFNAARQNLVLQAQAALESSSRNAQQAAVANQRAAEQAAAAESAQTLQLLQAMQPRPMPLPMPSQPVICTSRPGAGGTTTVCQ